MIGLDLGTTRCKAVVLDGEGRVVATVAATAPGRPTGIALSGAMHSCFPVADDGRPPHERPRTTPRGTIAAPGSAAR